MGNTKLVIFDFDGVLADTLEPIFAINEEVKPDLSLEEYKSFFEGNIHEAIASGKKKSIPDFDERFRARTRELGVREVFKKILHDLSLKYTLVIVSSSSSGIIKEILDRSSVANLFADIYGSDVNKNKIVKIKMLLEKYKINPENTIFITDTLGDVYEASECNIKSIAVTWGFHTTKTLLRGNPFAVIDNPDDLIPTIESIL